MRKYLLGGAAGVLAGYILANRQYNKMQKQDIENARWYFKQLYEEKLEREREIARNEGAIQAIRDLEGPNDGPPQTEEESVEEAARAVVNYNKLAASYSGEQPAQDVNKLVEPTGPTMSNMPHVITPEEFAGSETEYKQYTITYYAGDDILAGQSDKVIGDPDRTLILGKEILQKLKDNDLGDLDAVYVRSPQINKEFEVLRSSDKYAVVILGQSE